MQLKFIYSEKATKFCEISTVDSTVTTWKFTKVEISQKFVAFSEYMNFIIVTLLLTISPRVSQSGVIRLIPLVDLEYNIECTQNTFTNVKFEYYWLDVSQYFIFQALNTTMT